MRITSDEELINYEVTNYCSVTFYFSQHIITLAMTNKPLNQYNNNI